MTSLKFGHRNSLQSALTELAQQTEEIRMLLTHEIEPLRIIPLTNIPGGVQREQLLETLKKLEESIRGMCNNFEIKFEMIDVRHKISITAEYLKVIAKNFYPESLQGYGVIKQEDKTTLDVHMERILSLLSE